MSGLSSINHAAWISWQNGSPFEHPPFQLTTLRSPFARFGTRQPAPFACFPRLLLVGSLQNLDILVLLGRRSRLS